MVALAITTISNAAAQTATELPIADIHLPDSVNLWPPAIGWWIVGIASLLILWTAVHFLRKKITHHRQYWGYRKAALVLLKQHYQMYQHQQEDTLRAVHALSSVLKRTAISAYPHQSISSLYGQAWVECLNQQTSTPYFDSVLGDLLDEKQYQPDTRDTIKATDVDALYKACDEWITQHHSDFRVLPKQQQSGGNHV